MNYNEKESGLQLNQPRYIRCSAASKILHLLSVKVELDLELSSIGKRFRGTFEMGMRRRYRPRTNEMVRWFEIGRAASTVP